MLKAKQKINERYFLIDSHTSGGMGKIWLAKDIKLGIEVIIKVVRPDNQSESIFNNFKKEARIQALLQHDGIPQIKDFFDFEEEYLLVMEKIYGITLKEELEVSLVKSKKPFDLNRFLGWADQLLDILEYIHSKKVIHRDIKPLNIMLVSGGDRLKLIDFGIAKGNIDDDNTDIDSKTLVAKSAPYASIEQVLKDNTLARVIARFSTKHQEKVAKIRMLQSHDVDDIFSLGATLYEIVTNERPLPADERATEVWKNQPDPIKPIKNSNVPKEIAEVILKALSLERDERFASATEMRKELNSVVNTINEKEIYEKIENERIQLQKKYEKEKVSILKKHQLEITKLAKENSELNLKTIKKEKLINEEKTILQNKVNELEEQIGNQEYKIKDEKNRVSNLSNISDNQKKTIEKLSLEKQEILTQLRSTEQIATYKAIAFNQIFNQLKQFSPSDTVVVNIKEKDILPKTPKGFQGLADIRSSNNEDDRIKSNLKKNTYSKVDSKIKYPKSAFEYNSETFWMELVFGTMSVFSLFVSIYNYVNNYFELFLLTTLVIFMTVMMLLAIRIGVYLDEKEKKGFEGFKEIINEIKKKPFKEFRNFLFKNIRLLIFLGIIVVGFLISVYWKNSIENTSAISPKTGNSLLDSPNTSSNKNNIDKKSSQDETESEPIETAKNAPKRNEPLENETTTEKSNEESAKLSKNSNSNSIIAENKIKDKTCKIISSQDSVSLLNNGGSLGLIIGYEGSRNTIKVNAKSNSPKDIKVVLEPEIRLDLNKAFYIIKSVSKNKGEFTVDFNSPCGRKRVKVEVR